MPQQSYNRPGMAKIRTHGVIGLRLFLPCMSAERRLQYLKTISRQWSRDSPISTASPSARADIREPRRLAVLVRNEGKTVAFT
jgi:hypothetical protein